MKSNYWRTAPRQYINCMTGQPVVTKKYQNQKESRPAFRKCEKHVVRDLETGDISTAIIFSNGKVSIGDDVWRLSNRADTCDYPFRTYLNKQCAEREYEFVINPIYLSQDYLDWLDKECCI